ncbi:MAG TPA: amino acid adenylation domain-containing protein, partial [Pyrinomonadaceae bacterium]|nr:amino acid adenylation domain-containing protein [Pyrinomonadaceae bacterium]
MYSIIDSYSRSLFEEASRPLTLIELLRGRAFNQPSQKAYTFLKDGETEEVCLTYGELDRQARAIAATLQRQGAKGARVLLLYPPGLEYVAAFFGCLYAEMVAVPAYPPDPSKFSRSLPRLHSIVNDAQATVALTTDPILSRAALLFDESPLLKSLNWASGDNPDEGIENEWRETNVSTDELAFLQYTSGSTGTPKGVMLSHANLLHNAGLVYHGVEHTTADSYVSWLPTFHDMGFMAGILQPLYAGIPVYSMSPVTFLQRPLLWLKAISRYRATTSGAPNFAYDLCARKIALEQRAELDLSTWSVAFNGAEPIRPETMDRFVEAFGPCGFRREAFYPCYGLAEATLIVSGSVKAAPPVVKNFQSRELENHLALEADISDEKDRLLVGCGQTLREQKIVIAQPDSLTECLPGGVGEIWVSGGSVAQGYWNLPLETEEIFRAHLAETGEGPFLRTGDLGFLSDGELFVTGRLKDLIIIRGLNHYPQDIELTVERSHAALRPGCGAAFSVDVEGEERLVVVQEVEYRHQPDIPGVIENIRAAVAQDHEIQTHAVILIKPGRIPKTTSGKIQRRACRTAFLAASMEVVGEWRSANSSETFPTGVEETNAPLTDADDIATWLASEIAARVAINPSSVDVNQPPNRYGIDSLAAIELTHRIELRLGIMLPITSLFQNSSIAELAKEICARRANISSSPTLRPVPSPDELTEHPLSHGQQALWFLHQLAPESPAYNISAAVRVPSAIDVLALRRAFQETVNRHPSLRTTFTSLDGEPVQHVHHDFPLAFQEIDAAEWDADFLQEQIVEEANRPFDLESGPLLRVGLYRRTAEEYVLLLAVHHIVADFWSLAIMMKELGALYTAARNGEAATESTRALQYTDYVRWEAHMLASAEGERLRQYWLDQLSGALPTLDLPTDRQRPQVQTYRGDSFSFKLEAGLRDRLLELGQSRGATLYMSLLAAFEILLHRYANQDVLCVGSPMAGRTRAELAGIIGYFVNPVVLRADLCGNPTFDEFLDQVRGTVLGALDHQEYPFPLLVEQLQPERDASRSPLVQVMFALQKAHLPEEQSLAAFSLGETGARMMLGELPLESLALSERVAQFDLTLMMSEDESGLNASLQYNKDLFDGQTIERMAGHFQTLVNSIAADSQSRLSDLSLMPEDELRQVLVEWNKTQWEHDDDAPVHRLFESQAARIPDELAVASASQRLTYQELNARANRVAHYLRRLGVGAETPVAICMKRSVEMIVGQLGILKAGAAYLPLDPSSPQDRLTFMLRDSGARVLLTQQGLIENFSQYDGPVLCLDADLLTPLADESDANLLDQNTSPGNLAYIIYTSGSTGEPKGVEIQHDGLINLVKWHQRAYGITSGDRATQLAGPAFDASVWELWPYLTAGTSIHIPDDETRASATTLLQWLADEGITICFLPTPLAEIIIEETLPSNLVLRAILTGGDALHQGSTKILPFILVNHYGPTENTVVTTRAAVAQASAGEGPPPIGRPIDNTQVYLLDEHLRPVPTGVPGELHIGGPGLARCYRQRPDMTADKFIPHPFSDEPGARLYRTGDLARHLPDGQIEFLGRMDHQVIMRGFRIELGEIEVVLRGHAAVREAVVNAREDVPGNQRLVAYVVPAAHQAPAVIELQSFLKEKLPEHMVPHAFVMLDQLPLTPNGKIDRRALPAPNENAELESINDLPRTHVEELLAGIYAQVLGLKRVRLQDNFFALGGHSLLATQVISRVRQAFQVEIPLHALFESPTLAGLAGLIEQAMTDVQQLPVPPLMPVLRDSQLPLSFAQQRLWFLDQLEPGNALYNVPAAVRLRGSLDESALEQSLYEIVRRHESLRTTFKASDGEPVQIINAPQPLNIAVHDLRHLASNDRQAQCAALLSEDAQTPFDLSTGPLLRVRLIRLAFEESVLSLMLHHIISDGWSMGVFVQELSALYEAFAQGAPSPLAELPIQYADYAAWQRQWVQGEMLDVQLGYWKQQLAGAPPMLELPTDRPRPSIQTFRGASQTLAISKSLSDELKSLSQREGATLFMTLLAAFQVLLSRYSGQQDILVGTPVAGRQRLEIEGLIGFFVNTLVLRTQLSPDATFIELINQVREVLLAAHAHQDLPFEKLVEALQVERDLSRSPLFQVMFVLQNLTQYPQKLADTEMSRVETETSTAKFDLTLHMEEHRQGLVARLEYNTEVYDAVTIQQLLRHFHTLLASISLDPAAPLSRLHLLSPDELRQQLEEWNHTRQVSPPHLCLHHFFEQQAHLSPLSLALISPDSPDSSLSYLQLNERANQLAHLLRSLGIGPESIVGISLERSPLL